MPDLLSDILLAFAILTAKHTLADFFLQSPYQYMNKGVYGHPGGLIHAAIHAALTTLVYLALTPPTLLLALLIPAAEFIVHYHIDWAKERIGKLGRWTTEDPEFWRALGVDQLAHNLTYVLIIAVLIP